MLDVFDFSDRIYLMLAISLGIFYSGYVVLETMRNINVYRENEVAELKCELLDIKLQFINLREADLDKKIAENQKHDDELIAKIAADVLAKARELDKQPEICEDAGREGITTSLHVDCTTPLGSTVRIPLSAYIHGVGRGSILEGYTNARFGPAESSSSLFPSSTLAMNVQNSGVAPSDPAYKNFNMYVNIQTISGKRHSIQFAYYIENESVYKKIWPGYVILGIEAVLPKLDSPSDAIDKNLYVDIKTRSGENRRIALSTYITNGAILYKKIFPEYVIINVGILPPSESLPKDEFARIFADSLPENTDDH
jgi:hypothetical protein